MFLLYLLLCLGIGPPVYVPNKRELKSQKNNIKISDVTVFHDLKSCMVSGIDLHIKTGRVSCFK